MNFGRYWNRLSFRLPLLIILFSILIGVVVGSIAIVVANQSLEETFKEDMAVLRNERARAVVEELDSKKRLLETFPINLRTLRRSRNSETLSRLWMNPRARR